MKVELLSDQKIIDRIFKKLVYSTNILQNKDRKENARVQIMWKLLPSIIELLFSNKALQNKQNLGFFMVKKCKILFCYHFSKLSWHFLRSKLFGWHLNSNADFICNCHSWGFILKAFGVLLLRKNAILMTFCLFFLIFYQKCFLSY